MTIITRNQSLKRKPRRGRALTMIPAIRLQVYCNPAPVPRCCPWKVSGPTAFIAPYPIYEEERLLADRRTTPHSFQTHSSIEHVHNIPPQQYIGRFRSCAAEKCNTAERCVSWGQLMSMREYDNNREILTCEDNQYTLPTQEGYLNEVSAE